MIRRGGLARRMLALSLIMSALPVAVVLVVTLANREVLDEQLRLGEAVLPVVQSAEGVAAGAEQIAILVLQLSDAADVADVERIGHLLERRVAEVYTASVPAADVQQVVAMIRRMRASARASVTASAAFERAVLAAVEVSRRLAAAAEQSRVSLSMRAPVVARLAVSDVERFAADLRIMLDRLRASLEPEALREELLPLSRTATLRLGELRDAGLTVRLAEHLHDLSRYTGRLRAHGGDDVFALRGEAIRARGELLDVRGVVDVELQRLRDLVAARVDGAYRELADSGTRSVAAVQSAERIGSWVALGLVLVSAAGAWFYLRATVVTRFERLIESMGRIASGDVDGGGTEGDPRGDELARIEHAVSVFRERSRELLLKTEDLQQSEEQLRLANEDLQQFVYHASHDLRAPMRAIGALTSQLLEEGVPDSDARRSLELIRGRAVRLDRLVDDLLTYSHASTFEREAADVDLPALVADAAQLLSVPDGCVVACRGVERVRCNRVVAETVVRNLIQNSLKHHHDGAHARVTLSAELDGGMLVLRVSDDGPGIAPEHRERIFEPFSTLAPRDRVEGSGMGLAIVRRMLRASGGDIELGDPVDGRGACFVVTLPVEATAPGEDPAT